MWEMLYADDACIASRSPRGLGRMMAVFVEVFGTFDLTTSESKTETMRMLIPRAPATKIVFNATGQQYERPLRQAPYDTPQDVASNPRSLVQVAEQAHPLVQRRPLANRMLEHRNNLAHEEAVVGEGAAPHG